MIDYWPLYGLRLRTPRLELRLPVGDELAALADAAAAGVHAPDRRPFLTPWTEAAPAERGRAVIQRQWRRIGTWDRQDWALGFAVFRDGQPIGEQELAGREFAVRREVRSASWLGLAHHGQGLGTEMRAAVLQLAFAGLGAADATSASFADNPAPLRVSQRLGYELDGLVRDVLDGQVALTQRLRLTRQRWEQAAQVPVEVDGLAACLPEFGL
ncbi:putative succinyl-CoA transferase [Catellatospora sp. TT07R-123]|uniref:GNAT family N-acetyltransferase n=1 Tax=Catellatospora sp. TT07R-123 TaxID=2733863 RepID=UPI001B0AD33C|nr:GNAT family protein [Catellatospora sp. TT07R-123]GHJ46827.1 putative succinyl-CoA transferase [Catellatospora sp. TT07R-123]